MKVKPNQMRNRKCAIIKAAIAGIFISCSVAQAYEVWAGAACVPGTSVQNVNGFDGRGKWDGYANGVKGYNTAMPAYGPHAVVAGQNGPDHQDYRLSDNPLKGQFVKKLSSAARSHGMASLGTKACLVNSTGSTMTAASIKAAVKLRLEDEPDWRGVPMPKYLMIYHQKNDANPKKIVNFESSHIRIISDELAAKYPNVRLIWNVRNTNKQEDKDRLNSSMIHHVLCEGSPPHWDANGDRVKFLRWAWNNHVLTGKKMNYIWQNPAGGAEGDLADFYTSTRLVLKKLAHNWDTSTLKSGGMGTPFIQNERFIILPTSYSNTRVGSHRFWPELNATGTRYVNSTSGLGLSLIQQKGAFYNNTVNTDSYVK